MRVVVFVLHGKRSCSTLSIAYNAALRIQRQADGWYVTVNLEATKDCHEVDRSDFNLIEAPSPIPMPREGQLHATCEVIRLEMLVERGRSSSFLYMNEAGSSTSRIAVIQTPSLRSACLDHGCHNGSRSLSNSQRHSDGSESQSPPLAMNLQQARPFDGIRVVGIRRALSGQFMQRPCQHVHAAAIHSGEEIVRPVAHAAAQG